MRSTTILAHSMGGIVTRCLITKPERSFWDAAFKKPIEELVLSDADRETLKEAFSWEPEGHVRRVVYMAVLHLGSDYAGNWIGKLGRWLVKPPNAFATFYNRITSENPGVFTEAYAELGKGRLDSVHALSPTQPTLKILANLPNSHPVRVHSIIGNPTPSVPLAES